MSLSIPQPINTCLVVDPICDFSSEPVYAIEKSVSNCSFYNVVSNNSTSTSTTYIVNVNDASTLTDRVFLIDITLDVKIPIQNGIIGANLCAFRSFPLMKYMKTIQLQLGNGTTTVQIGDMANFIERYGLMNKYLDYSSTPTFPDLSAPYSATGGQSDPFQTSPEMLGTTDAVMPRGAFNLLSATATGTDLTLRVRLVEPLFISPLLQSLGLDGRKEAMTKLSQIQITILWGSPNRLLSLDDGLTLTGAITATPVNNQSYLRIVQYVPNINDVGRNTETQILPYNEFSVLANETLSLLPSVATAPARGVPQTFHSSVISLGRIPKELYIFVRPSNLFYENNTDPNNGTKVCDIFAYYHSGLLVNFNGTTQLSGISDISLYRICRQNGVNLPFSLWSGQVMNSNRFQGVGNQNGGWASGVGSPICLRFGRDIMLPPELASGCTTKCNLQVQGDFGSVLRTNAAPYDTAGGVPHTMYTVIVYEGSIEFYGAGNQVATTTGCLTNIDVLQAVKSNSRLHYDIVADGAFGGNIFSRAWNFFREGKYKPYLEKVKKFIEHPIMQAVSNSAVNHLKERGHDKVASLVDRATKKGAIDDALSSLGVDGSGLVGGRKMSKAQLKRALLG
jgi:hypothetical protein